MDGNSMAAHGGPMNDGSVTARDASDCATPPAPERKGTNYTRRPRDSRCRRKAGYRTEAGPGTRPGKKSGAPKGPHAKSPATVSLVIGRRAPLTRHKARTGHDGHTAGGMTDDKRGGLRDQIGRRVGHGRRCRSVWRDCLIDSEADSLSIPRRPEMMTGDSRIESRGWQTRRPPSAAACRTELSPNRLTCSRQDLFADATALAL